MFPFHKCLKFLNWRRGKSKFSPVLYLGASKKNAVCKVEVSATIKNALHSEFDICTINNLKDLLQPRLDNLCYLQFMNFSSRPLLRYPKIGRSLFTNLIFIPTRHLCSHKAKSRNTAKILSSKDELKLIAEAVLFKAEEFSISQNNLANESNAVSDDNPIVEKILKSENALMQLEDSNSNLKEILKKHIHSPILSPSGLDSMAANSVVLGFNDKSNFDGIMKSPVLHGCKIEVGSHKAPSDVMSSYGFALSGGTSLVFSNNRINQVRTLCTKECGEDKGPTAKKGDKCGNPNCKCGPDCKCGPNCDCGPNCNPKSGSDQKTGDSCDCGVGISGGKNPKQCEGVMGAPLGKTKHPIGLKARHSFPSDLEALMLSQIQIELNAGYAYMSMSAFFSNIQVALPGLSEFYWQMYEEEVGHAKLFMDYVNMRGGTVVLCPLKSSISDWGCITKALEVSLEMEKLVKEKLTDVYKMSNNYNDAAISDFVTELLREQDRSIEEIAKLLVRAAKFSNCSCGEHLFDEYVRKYHVKCPKK